MWSDVYRWDAEAKKDGVKRKVFTSSMADFFEGPETCQDAAAYAMIANARHRVFTEVIPNTPNLIHLLLTKRPGNILKMVPESWRDRFPDNVWVGTSVEDQKAANERIPHLLRVPAEVRFLSCEPLLGPVDLTAISGVDYIEHDSLTGEYRSPLLVCNTGQIHWVIAGGESGPNARPMHPDWARSLRDQCAEANVPFFFKQFGEHVEIPEDDMRDGDFYLIGRDRGYTDGNGRILPGSELVFRQCPWRREAAPMKGAEAGRWSKWRDVPMRKIGKKLAGRILDGVEWSQFPLSENGRVIR